jgi:C4-type Zn-finger protein
MEKHTETIKCPECESVQVATVLHTIPFPNYVHFCTCGYIITESEWQKVEEPPPE